MLHGVQHTPEAPTFILEHFNPCELFIFGFQQLNDCKLTETSCDIVASALQSSNSPLTDLDLSYNNLGDSGVEL
ncbi:hypothetical protein ANANG_G00212930, partial [Anguilla anguilla]